MKKFSKIFNNLGSSILFAFICYLLLDFLIYKFSSSGTGQVGSLTYRQIFSRLISAVGIGAIIYYVEKNRQNN